MPVSAHNKLGVHSLNPIQHLEPVEHRGIHRIVVYEEDRLLLWNCLCKGVQPYYGISGQQGRRHTHIWAAVAANEFYAALLKIEVLIAKYLYKSVAAALGPFGIVIACHYIIRYGHLVQDGFGKFKLLV